MREDMRSLAVKYLRYHLRNDAPRIRAMAAADPLWWTMFHLTWGMDIRNELRDAGYSEIVLGVNNLDDIYIELVEEAVKV